MALSLDFSGLNNLADNSALEAPIKKNETANKPHSQQEVNGVALVKLNREQEEHKKALRMHKDYQNNIRASEALRTEILKGVQAGEPAQLLFLKAVECISRMTGDKLFFNQISKDLQYIYGEALLEGIPLGEELKGVEERLEKLKSALKRDDTDKDAKKRIQTAIEEHKRKREKLIELLTLNEGETKKAI